MSTVDDGPSTTPDVHCAYSIHIIKSRNEKKKRNKTKFPRERKKKKRHIHKFDMRTLLNFLSYRMPLPSLSHTHTHTHNEQHSHIVSFPFIHTYSDRVLAKKGYHDSFVNTCMCPHYVQCSPGILNTFRSFHINRQKLYSTFFSSFFFLLFDMLLSCEVFFFFFRCSLLRSIYMCHFRLLFSLSSFLSLMFILFGRPIR